MKQDLNLPDVMKTAKTSMPANLQWVGMSDISVPFYVKNHNNTIGVTGHANVYVSLDAEEEKGIHMSRLYTSLYQQLSQQILLQERIEAFLLELVSSQAGISHNARLELAFELPIHKPALLSGKMGYQTYSIEWNLMLEDDQWRTEVVLHIPYSSTCPCSASLSRQLLSQAIDQRFNEPLVDKATLLAWIESEQGSIATPHSQRSLAHIHLTWTGIYCPDFEHLLRYFEQAIGTPVQTAVKRADEQEFARLNAKNLMFCEDAARKLKQALVMMSSLQDYWFKVEHQESLHAHNAVVIDRK
ncbi:GTP cyclohydrolase FolE2 [Vibrio palustris]|uniref:GTP cyclohydrolase FolE2 n=1 Tax=Vibrio palustris TaxID=1918946 RepID=A0A1R4B396_9VIBR|nr:GTP cyclohydrolase FolE2 [Vibrio palustris]SJL83390.1 GTP cyclohydrolase FolE2 [Vibrio palustris]